MFLNTLLQAVAEPGWLGPALTSVAMLLAIPIASSLVTSGLRRFTDATGLDPRALVWVVAVIITGVAYFQGSPALPVFESSNPAEYLSAWLLLATGFSEMAKVIYDRILSGIPVLAGPSSA